MHPIVKLAKDAVERFVRDRSVLPASAEDLPSELRGRAGVFVSLKERGMLRGCIGTFQPTQPSIAEEVVRNAISAAIHDPRFQQVRPDELADLAYSVDVLSPPEPAAGPGDLDPKRFGVIVHAGGRRGLLLPDLEGVDTVEHQVAIAMQKAGIPPGTPVDLLRFEVKRYGEH